MFPSATFGYSSGMPRRLLLLLLVATGLCGPGCEDSGCLNGGPECVVPAPCQEVTFQCRPDEEPFARLTVLTGDDSPPGGLDAIAAVGDFMLENNRVVAVIDGLTQRSYIAPGGGTIIDLSTRNDHNDTINSIFHTTGVGPADAVKYTEVNILEDSADRVAIQFSGALDGRPNVRVYTRYEMRGCEPGIRVRTELIHLEDDPNLFFLADTYWWGNREPFPFTPTETTGFVHPPLSLSDIASVWFEFDFVAAITQGAPDIAYAEVSCDGPTLTGVNTPVVSAIGLEPRIIESGENMVMERFIVAARGDDVAAAADIATRIRNGLIGEDVLGASGRVETADGEAVGGERVRASVVIYGASGATGGLRPLTHVVPDLDGNFEVVLPAGSGPFTAEVHSFGRPVANSATLVMESGGAVDFGTLLVPEAGRLNIAITEDGSPATALIAIAPADDATMEDATGSTHGIFLDCAPYLGEPYGPSPACNKAVAEDGFVSLLMPPGSWRVYATRGPFTSLGMAETVIANGEEVSLALNVTRFDMLPPGVLSGDFHVHGGASFDTSFPDSDRVLSFIANDVDVIAATDHDVVYNYAETIDALDVGDEVKIMTGVETTSAILWMPAPDEDDIVPKVIGHYNFWPVFIDPSAMRNGAPDDELLEPGELFDLVDTIFSRSVGVREMNHPWDDTEFGRDLGYFRAVGIDINLPIPAVDDGTPNGHLARLPAGGYSNIDYHAQEVINGTNQKSYMQYREIWFWMLNQGLLRTGVANSDSHSLNDSIMGYGRNLVRAGLGLDDFDIDVFNTAVIEGRLSGTNGPVLNVSVTGTGGAVLYPSMVPFEPATGAAMTIEVRAAPWIPVQEVRVIVNGEVVRTFGSAELDHPADPLGVDGLLRFSRNIPLAELLAGFGGEDVWILVEAGYPLIPVFDANGDGVPDTGDNNGDGVADMMDVEDGEEFGPLETPADPTLVSDPRYHATVVVPRLWPTAFTNPFLLDRNGGGWEAPGL